MIFRLYLSCSPGLYILVLSSNQLQCSHMPQHTAPQLDPSHVLLYTSYRLSLAPQVLFEMQNDPFCSPA